MLRHRSCVLAWLLPLGLLIPARSAFCQSYGLGVQTLTIGAAEFRPSLSGIAYGLTASNYLAGEGIYFAPLRLPDGAELLSICAYAYDPDDLSAALTAVVTYGLPAGGQAPGQRVIPGPTADFDIGYGVTCGDVSPTYTIRELADVGFGFENLAHYVYVELISNAALGGVKISWRRQVNPPPGTATFNDVPTTHPFFKFVEALHAAGITSGIGNGLYGVNDPITRGQMAVFLAAALGLHWPN